MKLKVYLAAPLFSEAERTFNSHLKAQLSLIADVFLPQEDGVLFAEMVANGVAPQAAAETVFQGDIAAIQNADILVALLDGRAIDEGVAFEIGFAFALGKKIVALQTDPRRLLPFGNNPMVDCAINEACRSIPEVLACLRRHDCMRP